MLIAAALSFMLPLHTPGGGRNIGSSVLIAPRLILTAAHVVKGPVMDAECLGERIPGAVVRRDDRQDLALIYLAHECSITPAKLAGANLAVGAPVVAVGCPDGNCGWQAHGHVMGYMGLPVRDLPERPVLVTDARIYFGNSGGPLLDGAGRLVGICSQIFRFSAGGDPSVEQWAPTLGAFVPIEAVLEFLASDDDPPLVQP